MVRFSLSKVAHLLEKYPRELPIEIKRNISIFERRHLIQDTSGKYARGNASMYIATRDCINLSPTEVHEKALRKQCSCSLLDGRCVSLPHSDLLPEDDRQIIWTRWQAGSVASLCISALLQSTYITPPRFIHIHVKM
jgi:hypothetical protein